MDTTYPLPKLNYTHDALVDQLVHNPMVTQRELARVFGYTEGWISRIIRSDAFREKVAARKTELIDPLVMQSLEQRFEALASRSAEILMEKLDAGASPDVALKTLEVSSRALGYGAQKTSVNVQQNFVVAMPPKSADSGAWVDSHSPRLVDAA